MNIILIIILCIITLIVGVFFVKKVNSKKEEDFKDWDITLMDGLEEENDVVEQYYEQMDKEVHQNNGNLNK